eukprot:sb/3473661/
MHLLPFEVVKVRSYFPYMSFQRRSRPQIVAVRQETQAHSPRVEPTVDAPFFSRPLCFGKRDISSCHVLLTNLPATRCSCPITSAITAPMEPLSNAHAILNSASVEAPSSSSLLSSPLDWRKQVWSCYSHACSPGAEGSSECIVRRHGR